jgi:hypothetical protein
MKWIALAILAAMVVSSSAHSAQNSTGIQSSHTSHEDGPSQFRADQVVVKIGKRHLDAKQSLKHAGLTIISDNGSGYCLGQGKCDLILTNYHVAERVGSPLEIGGVKVLQTYEATSAQDKGAVWEKSPLGFSVRLVPVRDMAVFRMERPLKRMHGISFSAAELREGENVRIYGHPSGGKLVMAEATYDGAAKDGLLFFRVKAGEERVLVPGLSGSLVVNEENEAVGLVQGIANGNLAAAVPVWSLADFIKKDQPDRYTEIFPSPAGGAIYRPDNSELVPVNFLAESEALAKDVDPKAGVSPPPVLPEEYLWYNLDRPTPPLVPDKVAGAATHVRSAEPPNVQALRVNAEGMAESINDLIAVGTQRSIGGKTPEVKAQYQLRMVAGSQTFTMDGLEMRQLPCPKGNGFGLSSAWSDFPTMVGNNLKLRIQQVDDLLLPGWGAVKVFRYAGTAEDKVAKIDYCTDYGFGIHTEKIIPVPVTGEVWTDDSLHILRITQELLAPPSMGWLNLRSSVLYGWLETPAGERRLVPTNIVSRAELTDDHQIYSTLCRITDYHRFTVSVIVGGENPGPII